MMKYVFIITLSALSTFSHLTNASEELVQFESEQQKADYRHLIKELRCPKCQNQNIADSNAIVAKDMRTKTLDLLQQGKSREEVIDYMVNRYGQFAHYQPPVNVATVMLWAVPIGFVLFCLLLLWRRSHIKEDGAPNLDDAELSTELEALLLKSQQRSAQTTTADDNDSVQNQEGRQS